MVIQCRHDCKRWKSTVPNAAQRLMRLVCWQELVRQGECSGVLVILSVTSFTGNRGVQYHVRELYDKTQN